MFDCAVGFGDEVDGWVRCVSMLFAGKAELAGALQFFFEPAFSVVGFADMMRSPAFLAMEIIKSWISWRLRSAMVEDVCLEGFQWAGDTICGEVVEMF